MQLLRQDDNQRRVDIKTRIPTSVGNRLRECFSMGHASLRWLAGSLALMAAVILLFILLTWIVVGSYLSWETAAEAWEGIGRLFD